MVTDSGALQLSPPRGAASHVRFAQLWSAAGIIALGGFFTANGLLTAAAVLVVPLIWRLTWRTGEPPVLFMACMIHWIQSFASVFMADLSGRPVEEVGWGDDIAAAVWLSLFGLVFLAAGVHFALRSVPRMAAQARAETQGVDPRQVFKIYLAAYALTTVLLPVAFVVPQITQFIIALFNIKWTLVFLMVYVVLQRKSGFDLMALVVALELVTGMVSYFSSFTRILFLLLLVIPTASLRLTVRVRFGMVVVAVIIGLLSIVWSAIKPEYRAFVNRGTGEQEVYVSAGEALGKISELVSAMDADAFGRGAEALAARVAYVDYFAATIAYVPAVVPHTRGNLWAAAVLHVLQPRLLFPDKPELDDSEVTREYTGLYVAGVEEGTSVSIGYFGESYIDFGAFGMMIPIFLVGLFWGSIYRLFLVTGRFRVVGAAIATSILAVSAFNVGVSSVKLVGGSLMAVLVMLVLRRYIIEPLFGWCGARAVALTTRTQ